MKCFQTQACMFREANRPCTISCPSEIFHNKGPTWTPPPEERPRAPTDLRLTTNINQNIEKAHEVAPILCQPHPLVIFQRDVPEFSTNFLTDR